MARRRGLVGVLRCDAEQGTVCRIVEEGGLVASRTANRDEFLLFDSGRIIASELRPFLLAAVKANLDRAVAEKRIPAWSLVGEPALSP